MSLIDAKMSKEEEGRIRTMNIRSMIACSAAVLLSASFHQAVGDEIAISARDHAAKSPHVVSVDKGWSDLVVCHGASWAETTVLVEAESFARLGGWVIDQQAMDQMGSPYVLAHGLGRPVADAETTIEFPASGTYHVWVRTRDWVGPWKEPGTPVAMRAEGYPGRFKLLVDGRPLETAFGVKQSQWHWQTGGAVSIPRGSVKLALKDLTGFEGRCDAILFSTDPNLVPPNEDPDMAIFRRRLLGFPKKPPAAGDYELEDGCD